MKKQILSVLSIILLGFSIISAQTDAPMPKTISGGVLNGKAQNLPIPEFPAAAKAVRASGAVNIKVTIDEDGSVSEASAVSGHPLLRQAAVNAARQAKFAPTQLSGYPVKVTGIIVYNFTPSGSASAEKLATYGGLGKEIVGERVPPQKTDNTISGGIINGKARNLAVPAYPAAAKAVNAEGAVNVQVVIDEVGNVTSADAVSGHPLLRSAAVQAAWASKFSPTMLEGQPVRVTGIIVYNFTGANSAMNKSSWFKTGFDLAGIQYNLSPSKLNINSFPSDWTVENQQLQTLSEMKQVESEMKQAESAGQAKNSPSLISATQSLIASLQSRLGNDELKYWQFNTGLKLSEAFAKSRNAGEKQSAIDSFRQQIQSAPNGVSPENLADLQTIVEFLEKQNPTTEDRVRVSQILQKLF